MWLNLEQIEYLQAVKESGSITAAAQKLRRAKSALYYSIKKLEEQLGFQVVETTQYRGTLTPKGEQFLKQAREILVKTEELKASVHKIATGVEVKVTMSATSLFPMSQVNQVVKKILSAYPETELVLHREILSGEKMLENGEVDVAICESLSRRRQFEYKRIGSTTLVLVIAGDHPFHDQTQKLENLFKYPQIVQRATIPNTEDSGGVFKQSKQWTVTDLPSKKQIICDGLGWGRLPDFLLSQDLKSGRLKSLVHIDKPVEVPIYLCRRKGKKPGKVLKEIWNSFS